MFVKADITAKVRAMHSSIQLVLQSVLLCILSQTPTTCSHPEICGVCCSSPFWAKYTATNSYHMFAPRNMWCVLQQSILG